MDCRMRYACSLVVALTMLAPMKAHALPII